MFKLFGTHKPVLYAFWLKKEVYKKFSRTSTAGIEVQSCILQQLVMITLT